MTTNLDPLTTSDYPWNIPYFGRTKLVHQRFQTVNWSPDNTNGRVEINLIRERINAETCKQFSTTWSVGFKINEKPIWKGHVWVTHLSPTGRPVEDAMMFTLTDLAPNYEGYERFDQSVPRRRQWPMWKSIHESKYTRGWWSDLIGEDSGINPKIYSGRSQFIVDPFVIEWIRQLFCASPGAGDR